MTQNGIERVGRIHDQTISGLKHQFHVIPVRTVHRRIFHKCEPQVFLYSAFLTEVFKNRKNYDLVEHKPCHTNVTTIRDWLLDDKKSEDIISSTLSLIPASKNLT